MAARFRLLLLISLGLLAACNDVPRPFAHTQITSLLVPPAPIYLAPIPDASDEFQDELVEALGQLDLPLSRKATGKQQLLEIQLEDGASPGEINIDFTLQDAFGNLVKSGILVVNPKPNDRLASSLAQSLHEALEEKSPLINNQRSIFIYPVENAPGTGGEELVTALKASLGNYGLALAASPAAASFSLKGAVSLKDVGNGQEEVKLTWTVWDSKGQQKAVIAQQSSISKGSLKQKWGGVAFDIANELIRGISTLRP